MVFLCVHKREHQVPENSIPVEYRIKDEVFIPFIRMKLGDISCLKSVCVGTKNTSDLAVKGLRHYFWKQKSGSACEKVGDSAAVLTVVGDGNGKLGRKHSALES